MDQGSIILSSNLRNSLGFLGEAGYSKIGVLIDPHTRVHCYPSVQALLPDHLVIEVPAGEEHKNLHTCELIWRQMTELNFDRHSLLLILGGGVLGDMGGF